MSVPGPASLWFRWVYLDVLQIKTKLSLTACMYDPNNLQLQISSSSMGGCDPWRYRHTIKNHIIVFKRTHIDRPHQTPATATKRERERSLHAATPRTLPLCLDFQSSLHITRSTWTSHKIHPEWWDSHRASSTRMQAAKGAVCELNEQTGEP